MSNLMATSTIQAVIVSAEKLLFSGQVASISVTGIMGEMGILPQHAPLLTALKPGQVRLSRADGEEELIYISGGMIEVQPHVATILADTAIRAHDLDEAAALEAKERAEEMLSHQISEIEFSKATAELAQAIAQLKAIQDIRKKYKTHAS